MVSFSMICLVFDVERRGMTLYSQIKSASHLNGLLVLNESSLFLNSLGYCLLAGIAALGIHSEPCITTSPFSRMNHVFGRSGEKMDMNRRLAF